MNNDPLSNGASSGWTLNNYVRSSIAVSDIQGHSRCAMASSIRLSVKESIGAKEGC